MKGVAKEHLARKRRRKKGKEMTGKSFLIIKIIFFLF